MITVSSLYWLMTSFTLPTAIVLLMFIFGLFFKLIRR